MNQMPPSLLFASFCPSFLPNMLINSYQTSPLLAREGTQESWLPAQLVPIACLSVGSRLGWRTMDAKEFAFLMVSLVKLLQGLVQQMSQKEQTLLVKLGNADHWHASFCLPTLAWNRDTTECGFVSGQWRVALRIRSLGMRNSDLTLKCLWLWTVQLNVSARWPSLAHCLIIGIGQVMGQPMLMVAF